MVGWQAGALECAKCLLVLPGCSGLKRRMGVCCVMYGLRKVISSNKLSQESKHGEAQYPIVTVQIIDLLGPVTVAALFSIQAPYPCLPSIHSRRMNYN